MKCGRFDGFGKLKFEVRNQQTDTKQPPTNLGLSFGVVNCLLVFPMHFNPNNSPLIILQISLLFPYTPALIQFQLFIFHKTACLQKKKSRTGTITSYKNKSGSLGQREMLQEHEPPGWIVTQRTCFLFLLANTVKTKKETACLL